MTTTRLLVLGAALFAVGGCAGRPIPPTPADPRPLAGRAWKSGELRDHPLVGYVLSVSDERWVGRAEVEAAVAGADYAFLGEIHDNPDHHLIQAELLRAVVAGGRRPAVAFEMIDTGQAEALAAAQAGEGATPEGVAAAVGWEKSGWPPFEAYRPIFEAALEARLEVVAANLPRPAAREAVRKGPEALPSPVRDAIARAGQPTPAELREWVREMEEDHCGELPASLLDGLVLAQRARDAQMALRVAERPAAVLVTGGGHARKDRGVPAWLARERQGARSVSVGLVEVDSDRRWPREYAEEYGAPRFPFDFVIFTPRAEREDPCEALRRRARTAKP